MASATSKVSVVSRGTSVRNKKKSYYVTDVTTLADGSLLRQTYRSDAKGNNKELIQTQKTDSSGKIVSDVVSSGASAQEKRDLENPNSTLRSTIRDQTKKAGESALKNEEQAAAGGLTDVGKKNLQVVSGGSGNKATTEENSGDTQPIFSTDIAGSPKTRKQFSDSVYPLDLAKTKQDVIKFTMLEYVPQDFNQSGQFGFSNEARQGNRNSIGTVILPIPGGIQDSNSVQWSGQNMNALEAAAANIALSTIGEGGKGLVDATTQVTNAIKKGGGEVKTALANAFAGAASGTGGQLLTRTTGAVINPNLELLFSGPALRTFSFQFKMNARERLESAEIVKIIRFFKQGSAAQRSESNLFLKSPHTFRIQYMHRGPDNENPFMNKIKECALLSVAVNYTPEGNYATFDDGAMTSYELTLSFQELEPVFNDDYAQDNDATIGF